MLRAAQTHEVTGMKIHLGELVKRSRYTNILTRDLRWSMHSGIDLVKSDYWVSFLREIGTPIKVRV